MVLIRRSWSYIQIGCLVIGNRNERARKSRVQGDREAVLPYWEGGRLCGLLQVRARVRLCHPPAYSLRRVGPLNVAVTATDFTNTEISSPRYLRFSEICPD